MLQWEIPLEDASLSKYILSVLIDAWIEILQLQLTCCITLNDFYSWKNDKAHSIASATVYIINLTPLRFSWNKRYKMNLRKGMLNNKFNVINITPGDTKNRE